MKNVLIYLVIIHTGNSSTAQKGYSGVSIWSKEKPLSVSQTLEHIPEALQKEGRILTAHYENFVVVNVYTPNTLRAGEKPLNGWEAVRGPRKKKTPSNDL